MLIINQTKNTTLAQRAWIADTPLKRMKGLLGKKELFPGEALVIRPCNSIHTLFMRFPIDVLFVDKNNRVVKAIPNLKPFRLTAIYFPACQVIELPAGTIASTLTESGHILRFQDTCA